MSIFVNGGGSGTDAAKAYKKLGCVTDSEKPILYIPFAMDDESYPSCLEWITGELSAFSRSIDMVTSASMLSEKALSAYGFIFIGGGNTFKLLSELRKCGCLEKLAGFIADGGVVFGGSAGAIIFGEDIDCAIFADPNDVGLKETGGLALLGGASVFPHYDAENNEQKRFLTEFSAGRRIIALPEADTLLVSGGSFELIGTLPIYEYADGVCRELKF